MKKELLFVLCIITSTSFCFFDQRFGKCCPVAFSDMSPDQQQVIYQELQQRIVCGHLRNSFLSFYCFCGKNLDAPFQSGLYEGFTPLTLALQLNRPVAIKLLLKYGANPNYLDGFGSHPLEFAFDRAWIESIRYMLDKRAFCECELCAQLPRRVSLFSFMRKYYPFTQDCINWMLIGARTHYDIVSLICFGADINYKNLFGATAIDNAVRRCDDRTIKVLLNCGANQEDIRDYSLDFIFSECKTSRCTLGVDGERHCYRTRKLLEPYVDQQQFEHRFTGCPCNRSTGSSCCKR
jgi:hypothetical protein